MTQTLNKYQLENEIGRGAYARVYRAVDTHLERPVALKLLHPQLLADPSFVERFQVEAKTMARLNHPHIATVYDVGEAGGQLYLAMELAHGPSLAQRLEQGALPWPEALALLRPIAAALDAAHRQGVIHRDLKPANILLDPGRGPLLTDFGLARLVSMNSISASLSGGIIGTPPYIAPEVWELDAGAPPADLYALGCITYELFTGERLFEGNTPLQIMRAHDKGAQFDPAKLAGLPPGLEPVLGRAVAPTPADRYPIAKALVETLAELEQATARRQAAQQQAEAEQLRRQAEKEARWRAKAEARLREETARRRQAEAAAEQMRRQKQGGSSSAGRVVRLLIIAALVGAGLIGAGLLMLGNWGQEAAPQATTPSPSQGEGRGGGQEAGVIVFVPGGPFTMGSHDGQGDEQPVHTVQVDGFWIDRTEVTNAQYAEFLDEMGNQTEGGVTWLDAGDQHARLSQNGGRWQANAGYSDHPVTEVSWYGARAYCEWRGGRLPTEAEWEKAARGTDGRIYPWGDRAPDCNLAQFGECDGATVPVGSFPSGASPYGALDMAGNVWEWTADWYDGAYYGNSPESNPSGPSSGGGRVLRGGGWVNSGLLVRAANRSRNEPTDTLNGVGFRCARSP